MNTQIDKKYKKRRKEDTKKESISTTLVLLQKVNEQCLNAMLKEQQIAKQKIYKLWLITVSKLKEMRILASGLYSKLDDWIINGIKFENQEIYNYINCIRTSIQNQQRSNLKLQEHPPVSQIYKPLHYFNANPYFFPFFETRKRERFLVYELKLLLEDVKSLAADKNFIEKKVLEEYLIRRKNHHETNDYLPERIRGLKDDEIRKGIEKLDVNRNNLIDWRLFMNSMVLLNTPLISSEQEDKMKEFFGDQKIDLESFINVISS